MPGKADTRTHDRHDQRNMNKTAKRIGACQTPRPKGGEQECEGKGHEGRRVEPRIAHAGPAAALIHYQLASMMLPKQENKRTRSKGA